ncbi:MAG: hypothetical protein ACK41O_27465, partial [Runella zeae]
MCVCVCVCVCVSPRNSSASFHSFIIVIARRPAQLGARHLRLFGTLWAYYWGTFFTQVALRLRRQESVSDQSL